MFAGFAISAGMGGLFEQQDPRVSRTYLRNFVRNIESFWKLHGEWLGHTAVVTRILYGRSQIHYLRCRDRTMVVRDFRFSIPLFWWLQFEHIVRWVKPLGRTKKEWLSPRSGELGWVCWRQDDTAGQHWDFEAGMWLLSPYWLLSVALASSQLWIERSTLVVNRALLLY